MEDALVDPLMADAEVLLLRQPKTDLLGTPVLAQLALDQVPVLRGNPRLNFGLAAVPWPSGGPAGADSPSGPGCGVPRG